MDHVLERPPGGALAVANDSRQAAPPEPGAWTQDQIDLLKRTICRGATDDELQMFLYICRRTGLDPFTRQIYAVKRYDSREKREVMATQVGIDGLRLVAERTGEADGQEGPYWCGPDGKWLDVWLSGEPPAAARVLCYRRGQAHPYVGVARYGAYVQLTKDGRPNTFWARMPDVMLAKCAEGGALRKAFPAELSGLYLAEELQAAEAPPARPGKSKVPDQAPSEPRLSEEDDHQLQAAVKAAAEALGIDRRELASEMLRVLRVRRWPALGVSHYQQAMAWLAQRRISAGQGAAPDRPPAVPSPAEASPADAPSSPAPSAPPGGSEPRPATPSSSAAQDAIPSSGSLPAWAQALTVTERDAHALACRRLHRRLVERDRTWEAAMKWLAVTVPFDWREPEDDVDAERMAVLVTPDQIARLMATLEPTGKKAPAQKG